jgi:hypothetical protein
VTGILALWMMFGLVACSGGAQSDSGAQPAAGSSTPRAPASSGVTTPATTAPVASTIPVFSGAVAPVSAVDLGDSWHEGCPVGPADLRQLRLSYWGFDDRPHLGALVVHADAVSAVLGVFQRLYEQRFPIRRMDPIATFGGSDPASMDADNTSGFNCRLAVADGPPQWSVHAYGEAIDVNPVENPYLQGGTAQPTAGNAYLDRENVRPGMAVSGGVLVDAFAAAGWQWGGRWDGTPDYQHFSANGG